MEGIRLGKWRVRAERTVYESRPWLTLIEQDIELPNGVEIRNYLVSRAPDVVMIFAVTEARYVLFVEQYKHGMGEISLDLPAGYMDDDDDSPLSAAQRELVEETGHVSEKWGHLASLNVSPNRSRAMIHYFLAENCRPEGTPHLDPTEELEVRYMPLSQLEDLVPSGRVKTLSTFAGIALGLRALLGASSIS